MKRLLVIALSVAVFAVCPKVNADPIPGEKMGVVLMHGKWDTPSGVSSVTHALRSAGVLVVTPEMPWSRKRAYAKSYEDSMKEIDAAVERLRKKGARRILVGGHSLGGNAALGYGARRDGLAGLILLAPGHVPGRLGFDRAAADSVGKARKLVSAGKGGRKASFRDPNVSRTRTVSATADIFLSWLDPTGPAVMTTNAALLKENTPVFCADGTKEFHPRCPYVGLNLPDHPNSRSIKVKADHVGVPAASRQQLLSWLRGL
jgi:pimeloyl-ACP methyl ester carboxylesterase